MLTHVGTKSIETERLLLRKFEIEDAKPVFENWAKDPENVKYLSWKAYDSLDQMKEFLNHQIEKYKNDNFYCWCITFKDTGEVIGDITVNMLKEDNECCAIGYVISKKHWGKGIMPEALDAVLNYLFSNANFHRVQLMHDVDNPASGRVMQKCGMHFEGVLRGYDRANSGNWCNDAIYSILRDEYFEFKKSKNKNQLN